MLRPRQLTWAQLLRRVFHADVESCPRCGDALRIVAVITAPAVAQAILDSLTRGSRAPTHEKHRPALEPPRA